MRQDVRAVAKAFSRVRRLEDLLNEASADILGVSRERPNKIYLGIGRMIALLPNAGDDAGRLGFDSLCLQQGDLFGKVRFRQPKARLSRFEIYFRQPKARLSRFEVFICAVEIGLLLIHLLSQRTDLSV